MATGAADRDFAALIDRPDEAIDLARAALVIASAEYASLDVESYMDQLEQLAREARSSLTRASTAPERIAALNAFLYGQKGFQGNQGDYYDARNSYLNEVLERRTGIPITLAIVYIDVANRLGMDVRGVGFPGHFLVKCVDEGEVVIDPFSGEILSRAECEERYRSLAGADVALHPRALDPASKHEILARVLRNLKQIHAAKGDLERALACCERILLLLPEEPGELRDRGLLLARLDCHAAALADLERFIQLAPRDPTVPAVRARIRELGARVQTIH